MVILGAILLVTVPSITKTLKQKEEDEYKRFLNDIYLATESYIGMRVKEYPELVYSNKAVVELKELISAGYISENKMNPRTNEVINPKETVEVTKDSDGFYSYKLSGKENGFSSYITDGLLLWYDGKKHGNEEYIWNDISGNGRHGILYNYEENSGKIWKDNGLDFDGINDYVEQDVLQPEKVTLEATVYIYGITENAVNNQQMIITNVAYSTGFSLYFINDGRYKGSARLYNNNSWGADIGEKGDINQVIHVVYSYDGNIAKIYHNGTLVNSKNITDEITPSPHKLRLGAYPPITTYAYKDMLYGNLKSVKIYNRALTDEEVTQNYEIEKMRFGI